MPLLRKGRLRPLAVAFPFAVVTLLALTAPRAALAVRDADGNGKRAVKRESRLDRYRKMITQPRPATPESPAAGEAGWVPLNLFGGAINMIAASPLDPNLVMAAGELTWPWVSRDGGQSWQLLELPDPGTEFWCNSGVIDLEFAADGTPYVLTLCTAFRGSLDARSWTVLDIPRSSPGDLWWQLAINPTDVEEVWVASNDYLVKTSVRRSTDGGATWTDVSPPGISEYGVDFTAITFNPNRPGNVVITDISSTAEVWYTLDSGASWELGNAGVTAPSDVVHDGTRFYMSDGISYVSLTAAIYASNDNGATWSVQNTHTDGAQVYDLVTDPHQPGEVLAATSTGIFRRAPAGAWSRMAGTGAFNTLAVGVRPSSPRGILFGTDAYGVRRSDDNGQTWVASSHGLRLLSVSRVEANPVEPNELVASSPQAGRVEMYSTLDGGITWALAPTSSPTVPPVSYRFDTFVFGPDGTLYAAPSNAASAELAGIFRRESDGSWTRLGPPLSYSVPSIRAIRVGHHDPDLIFAAGYDAHVRRPAILRSTDGGASWERVYMSTADPSFRHAWYTDIAIAADGTDKNILVSQEGYAGLVVSHDGGTTWNGSTGLVDPLLCMSVRGTPADPLTFYLANRQTIVDDSYKSVDGGSTWQPLGPHYVFEMLEVDPFHPNVVYGINNQPAVATPNVLRSVDGGDSFSNFDQGLTSGYYPSAITWWDRGTCPTLLLATNIGVYARTIDAAPPELTVSLEPNVLWPPNHKMHTIHARVAAADMCGGSPTVQLKSIVVDDGNGATHVPLDVRARIGSGDLTFDLRAERPGKGSGRRYLVTYSATDASGNTSEATATVLVPHAQPAALQSEDENGSGRGTPQKTELVSISPNPFNPSTSVSFTLARAQHVTLTVYDVRGARVRELASTQYPAGIHRVTWDGVDSAGATAASGAYWFRFVAGDKVQTMKALLIK